MVTRKISPEDFGLWTLIGSIVSYVIVIEPIVSYWTTRQVARGEEVGKTAFTVIGVFSVIGMTIYLLIAIFVSSSLGADLSILILASLLIPLNFITNILSSISLSYRPQAISYGSMLFEISKIPLGVLFVVLLELGIVGALLTTILSTAIKMIILMIMAKNKIAGTIKLETIKFWIRMSWLPLYINSFGLIHKLDVLIFSTITGSFVGVAYWGIAITLSSLVGHSGTLSQALYPKLLVAGRKQIAEQNLKTTMYFAIPLFAASIIFAKPALHILNPFYIDGYFIIYFIALRTFMAILMDISFNILQAYETVDLDKNATQKQYIKSKLFFVPTLQYLLAGSYVITLTLFLLLVRTPDMSDAYLVTIWSFILFAVTLPIMIYSLILIRKKHQITLPYTSILKFSGVALLSATLLYFISDQVLTYPTSIWAFLPQLIPLIAFGGLTYFGLTYLIDGSAKTLFKSIFAEIKKR